jgi:hypothetical protein
MNSDAHALVVSAIGNESTPSIHRTRALAFTSSLLARFLLLKHLQVMPDHTSDRLLVSGKLQSEGLESLAGVQKRDDTRGATVVGKIATFHRIREFASDDIFDLVESITCQRLGIISRVLVTVGKISRHPILSIA